MKICFIYNGSWHFGIEYLSSFIKSKGHKVDLLFDPAVFSGDYMAKSKLLSSFFKLDNKIVEKVIASDYDLIAFSAFTGNYRWCLRIAEKIKKRKHNIPVVFGGIHVSACYENVLTNKCVDFCIIGEGELAFSELLDVLENHTDFSMISNLGYKKDGKIFINHVRPYLQDLDALPFPDKDLFFHKVPFFKNDYCIITNRGCPYRCSYCSNDVYKEIYRNENKYVRQRSPDNIIAELMEAKKRYGIKYVSFEDDVFTISYKWLNNFSEKYIQKIGLPFKCMAHPDSIDEKKIKLLKKMKCHMINIGIQSASNRIRKNIFNRGGDNDRIVEVSRLIKDAGIMLSVHFIFGAPTETEKDLLIGLNLLQKIKPDRIFTYWLTYYPKTNIITYAKKSGVISDRDIKKIEEGFTGFTHSTGSISEHKMPFYKKYQILYLLYGLIHNTRLYSLVSRILISLPFKTLISTFILIFTVIKNRDLKTIYMLGYIFAKKNVP